MLVVVVTLVSLAFGLALGLGAALDDAADLRRELSRCRSTPAKDRERRRDTLVEEAVLAVTRSEARATALHAENMRLRAEGAQRQVVTQCTGCGRIGA